MPPRLLQRARRVDAAVSARSATDDPPLELPPYEPPTYPMDERTKQRLANMSTSRDTDSDRRKYEKHLTKSSTFLFESVGSINDVLFSRKQMLAAMAEKRRTKGVQDKTEAEVQLEEYVAQLESTVGELTDSSEEALRWVIDSRAELEDQQAVLEMVLQGVNAQRPRPEPKPPKPKKEQVPGRHTAGSDGDDDADAPSADEEDEAADGGEGEAATADAPPIKGVTELLEAARKTKLNEYNALSPHRRYALNNDYISFKKNWHDALHPEDQVPLPDASTWFDEHGRPTKGVAAGANGDEDLVVEREIIDLKCPLSLQVMKEPYSNHQCKHTFEKSAIIEFIRGSNGTARCPVFGCSKELRIKDLYLDEVILRKIKRAEQASRRDVDDTSDIEPDDEDDSSLVVGSTKKVKKEKGRSRRVLEDIDDK